MEEDGNHKQEEEDPLGIKELALNYDYLIYKINDHIKSLSDLTYENVAKKESQIKQDYLEDQLHIAEEMIQIDQLIRRCDEIESEFMKLDQLEMFVADFKSRLAYLETEFGKR